MTLLKRLTQTTVGALTVIVAVVALNIVLSKLFLRADTTQDRVYSLSEGSRNIARTLNDEVTAKLYFSGSTRDLPVVFKTYGNRVAEVLREYASASKGKLRVQVIDPKPDTDDEEWARKYGLNGINLGAGQDIFLGVVFVSGDKESAIPYLDPRKEEFLEYDLSEALLKLRTTTKPKLGLMSPLPMQGGVNPLTQEGGDWVIVSALKNSFEVVPVSIDVDRIEDSINTLVVVHPKNFTDKVQWALDQFVLRGGRLIVAVDPFSRIDLAQNPQGFQGGQAPQVFSNLDRLFKAWGIEYNASELVGDPLLATRINAAGQVVNYPFFINASTQNLDREAKVTAHLKQMLFAEPGAFDLKADSGLKLQVLASTTGDSGTHNSMMLQFMRPADVAASFKTDNKKRTLAGLISGKFKSAFPEGAPQGVSATTVLKESTGEGLILLVTDVDFLHDSNAVDKMQFGPQVIVRPRNDNLNFLMNAAEFMGGSQDLISIRSSGKVARPFTRVLELQKKAQARWKEEEERLSRQLTDLQKNLSQLQAARTDANRTSLSQEQQSEIQRFRDQEVEVRRQRREVRKNLREEIEALGHRLVAANLLIVPLMVSAFGFLVLRRRERRTQEVVK